MFRGRSDLDVINEGTEYTKQIAAARTAQLETIRNNLRGMSKTAFKSYEPVAHTTRNLRVFLYQSSF
jgi:hypothetical protein